MPYKVVRIDTRSYESKAWVLVFANVPKCIDVVQPCGELRTVMRFNQLCSKKRWEGLNYIQLAIDVIAVYLKDTTASNTGLFDLQIQFHGNVPHETAELYAKVINMWYFDCSVKPIPLSRWMSVKIGVNVYAKEEYLAHKQAVEREQQRILNASRQSK